MTAKNEKRLKEIVEEMATILGGDSKVSKQKKDKDIDNMMAEESFWD